jgi:hypothetical protein
MNNKTVINDIHRELEFISKDLPMSNAMCQYLLCLSTPQGLTQTFLNKQAKCVLREQLADLDYYYMYNQ